MTAVCDKNVSILTRSVKKTSIPHSVSPGRDIGTTSSSDSDTVFTSMKEYPHLCSRLVQWESHSPAVDASRVFKNKASLAIDVHLKDRFSLGLADPSCDKQCVLGYRQVPDLAQLYTVSIEQPLIVGLALANARHKEPITPGIYRLRF